MESIRNQGTRARTGDVAPSWGWSQRETADPSLAPQCAQKPAHAGDSVIARDDSGARGWIEEIGKIETERESMRDSTLNVKYGQLLFTQWFIRTNRRGACMRNRSNDALGPEAKPAGRGQSVH
jgi:hypothetical protein